MQSEDERALERKLWGESTHVKDLSEDGLANTTLLFVRVREEGGMGGS